MSIEREVARKLAINQLFKEPPQPPKYIPRSLKPTELAYRDNLTSPEVWSRGLRRFERFYKDPELGLDFKTLLWGGPMEHATLVDIRKVFNPLKETFYPQTQTAEWNDKFALVKRVFGLGTFLQRGTDTTPTIYSVTPLELLQWSVGFLATLETDF